MRSLLILLGCLLLTSCPSLGIGGEEGFDYKESAHVARGLSEGMSSAARLETDPDVREALIQVSVGLDAVYRALNAADEIHLGTTLDMVGEALSWTIQILEAKDPALLEKYKTELQVVLVTLEVFQARQTP